MNIITDERVWVEGALSARSLGSNPAQALDRIARYYHQHCGYAKRDIPNMLEKFLIRCNPDTPLVLWSELIEKVSKQADRKPLIKLDGVSISHTELDAVDDVNGIRQKRLLFTLICLAKYENFVRQNHSNWVRTEYKHIMALANIVTSSQMQLQLLRDLYAAGKIEFARRVDDLSIRVLCLDDGDQELFITDFRNLGNQYLLYAGGPFMHCEECDLVVKRKSNAQRYCPTCAGDMYIKHSIESVQRQRAASLYGNILN